MTHRVDIFNRETRAYEPHFHGTEEECREEAADVRESGERARVVSDAHRSRMTPQTIALLDRTSGAKPPRIDRTATVDLAPGDRVQVETWDGGKPLPSFRGTVVEVKPSGTVIVDHGTDRDGMGNPRRIYVQRGTVCKLPAETNPDNVSERRELGALIADLAEDDYVTTTEAAAVVEWCRDWFADVNPHADAEGVRTVSAEWLLDYCERRIDGGLRFVLDDVRRVADVGSTEPCDCGTVLGPNGGYVTHAIGDHEDCTGLDVTYSGEDQIVTRDGEEESVSVSYVPADADESDRNLVTFRAADLAAGCADLASRGARDLIIGAHAADFLATAKDEPAKEYVGWANGFDNRTSGRAPWMQESMPIDPPVSPPLGVSSLTDAQALTVDKLAEHLGELCGSMVHSSFVPDTSGEPGTVLAILTADTPSDDPVKRVWSSSGRSCYPVATDDRYGPDSYASALAYIAADGLSAIVQRESSLVFSVAPGGAYEIRRFT